MSGSDDFLISVMVTAAFLSIHYCCCCCCCSFFSSSSSSSSY